jgi:hypothetical protein
MSDYQPDAKIAPEPVLSNPDDLEGWKRLAEAMADRWMHLRATCQRLLDPDDLGWAVTAEVRQAIQKALKHGR